MIMFVVSTSVLGNTVFLGTEVPTTNNRFVVLIPFRGRDLGNSSLRDSYGERDLDA